MEFSALAVQQVPEQAERKARMYVAGQGVRMEYEQNGQSMVEIYNLDRRKAWLLMPGQRLFMERDMPDAIPSNFMTGMRDENPCTGIPEVECRRLGEESIAGRPAVKWEMTGEQDGRTLRSLHWIDRTWNIPLRQLWPDGTVSEMHLLGRDVLHGRETEKWEWVSTDPKGNVRRSTQWYDPQLMLSVREELPGGYLRELRDIQVAAQPDALFRLPGGYQRFVPPEMPRTGQSPAGGQGTPAQAPHPQSYR